MKLSICIPTYNRSRYLRNCLQSLKDNPPGSRKNVEILVSDNASPDDTPEVVRSYRRSLGIKYHRNDENIGLAGNVLKVVSMASGEFCWLIGDDDLLLPDAIPRVLELLKRNPKTDFFYVNSFHLTTEFVLSAQQPFRTVNLPENMKAFSEWEGEGPHDFMDLVNPKVSFDFLGGMFLAVFRRSSWVKHTGVVSREALASRRTYSHFDNTFVHLKIFGSAFASSRAYFHRQALSVNLTGAREWAPMYPLVRSVRLPEALDHYRRNGLKMLRYHLNMNAALAFLIPDIAYMLVRGDTAGRGYISLSRLMWRCWPYPNAYLSLLYYLGRKIKGLIRFTSRKRKG